MNRGKIPLAEYQAVAKRGEVGISLARPSPACRGT